MSDKSENPPWQILSITPTVDGITETQYLAIIDGKCVGRVGVKSVGLRCAGIRQLFVKPEYRGNGIGKALVRQCILKAGVDGCQAVNLSVGESNKQVIPFYEHFGFFLAAEFSDGDSMLCLQFKSPSPKQPHAKRQ